MPRVNIQIIERNITGCATDEEQAILHSWLTRDKANRDTYFRMKNIWDSCRIKGYSQEEIHREWEVFVKRINERPQNTRRFRKTGYAAAAAIFIGVVVFSAIYLVKPKSEQTVAQAIEMITQRGETKTIYLPDQTKVTLNAESRLSYPATFVGERSVELLGEAIFEVTSDNGQPFTVVTADMRIKVLGTVFNVKAYRDDLLASVSVVSGKVEVNLPDGKALLEKNHQVRMDKTTGDFEKLTIDAEKYVSWTKGTLYFNDTPVREVVNMLNRSCPHMVFELAKGDFSNLISGKLDTHYLESELEPIIHSIGLQYVKKDNKIILY